MTDDLGDEEFRRLLKANGILAARKAGSGEILGVQAFMYTFGLLVGVDRTGYRTRFCYEHLSDAVIAMSTWEGEGDPPGPWIKQKGGVERVNPLRLAGIPIVIEEREQ